MGAYIALIEHPIFYVSNTKGKFKSSNIPGDKYIIEAWHVKFGTQTTAIVITENGVTELNFIFKN